MRIGGVGVDALDVGGLLDRVGELIAGGRSTVAYVNVHVLNQAAHDRELAAFLDAATVVYADGAGVVLGARILGQRLPERMTGADFIWGLAARAEREGWRLAWVGGAYGVTAAAARALQTRFPALQVVFTGHGYVPGGTEAHDRLLEALNAARPDVVLVGMGTPEQERWVAAHRARIEAPVVWCIGATADFVSGTVDRGPRWLHTRQEWLARLLTDPRRLWRRYLVGNPRYLARVLRERART